MGLSRLLGGKYVGLETGAGMGAVAERLVCRSAARAEGVFLARYQFDGKRAAAGDSGCVGHLTAPLREGKPMTLGAGETTGSKRLRNSNGVVSRGNGAHTGRLGVNGISEGRRICRSDFSDQVLDTTQGGRADVLDRESLTGALEGWTTASSTKGAHSHGWISSSSNEYRSDRSIPFERRMRYLRTNRGKYDRS